MVWGNDTGLGIGRITAHLDDDLVEATACIGLSQTWGLKRLKALLTSQTESPDLAAHDRVELDVGG